MMATQGTLVVTDGTTRIDLLSTFVLEEWTPRTAEAKGGGVWRPRPPIQTDVGYATHATDYSVLLPSGSAAAAVTALRRAWQPSLISRESSLWQSRYRCR